MIRPSCSRMLKFYVTSFINYVYLYNRYNFEHKVPPEITHFYLFSFLFIFHRISVQTKISAPNAIFHIQRQMRTYI